MYFFMNLQNPHLYLPWLRKFHQKNIFSTEVVYASVSSIKAAIKMRKALKLEVLVTNRISQDTLELSFAHLRSFGGNDNNPNAYKFGYRYVHLLNKQALKTDLEAIAGANVMPAGDQE